MEDQGNEEVSASSSYAILNSHNDSRILASPVKKLRDVSKTQSNRSLLPPNGTRRWYLNGSTTSVRRP